MRRLNEEFEETKNKSMRMKEELNETIEEGKKITSEVRSETIILNQFY